MLLTELSSTIRLITLTHSLNTGVRDRGQSGVIYIQDGGRIRACDPVILRIAIAVSTHSFHVTIFVLATFTHPKLPLSVNTWTQIDRIIQIVEVSLN